MKLWLVCFLVLFFGAEMAQWLGRLPWLGRIELSLPLTVLGGIGLAIASNYRHWLSVSTLAARPEQSPPPAAVPSPSPAVLPQVKSPTQAKISTASRKADTISFEIKKPQREVDR